MVSVCYTPQVLTTLTLVYQLECHYPNSVRLIEYIYPIEVVSNCLVCNFVQILWWDRPILFLYTSNQSFLLLPWGFRLFFINFHGVARDEDCQLIALEVYPEVFCRKIAGLLLFLPVVFLIHWRYMLVPFFLLTLCKLSHVIDVTDFTNSRVLETRSRRIFPASLFQSCLAP